MDLAGYEINAVLVEGRSVKEVCEAHDISRSWPYEHFRSTMSSCVTRPGGCCPREPWGRLAPACGRHPVAGCR